MNIGASVAPFVSHCLFPRLGNLLTSNVLTSTSRLENELSWPAYLVA
jgi:hypothetical protein